MRTRLCCGVGRCPGRNRGYCGAMAAHAARSLSGIGRDARGRDCRAPDNAQLLTARDAAKPGLLFAVSDDEHDVDQRADGRLQCWAVRQGIRRRRHAGSWHGCIAAIADAVARDERTDPSVLRLDLGPYRPRTYDGVGILARSDRHSDTLPRTTASSISRRASARS